MFNWSRSICREASKATANAKTVAAVVSLARSDRHHATTTDVWNTDDMLFSTTPKETSDGC